MGMYNEVYKKCPICGKSGTLQISQIVLGFGCFDLDNPQSIIEDFKEQGCSNQRIKELLNSLKERVEFALRNYESFECSCGNRFDLTKTEDKQDALIDIVRSIGHEE